METIKGAAPFACIYVLVLVGCVNLVFVALGQTDALDQRPARRALGDQGIAAVHIQQAVFSRDFQGLFRGHGIAAPQHHLHVLAGRQKPLFHVVGGPGQFALQSQLITGNVKAQRAFTAQYRARLLAGLIPIKRMRIGVRGRLHVRQLEHALGDILQLFGTFRIEPGFRHLTFDHRKGGGYPVPLENLLQQHFAGGLAAIAFHFREIGKTVAVHMRKEQPPPIFSRHIRHRHLRQLERGAQERQRLDHPAVRGFFTANGRQRGAYYERVQGIAAPRGNRHGCVLLVADGKLQPGFASVQGKRGSDFQ